MKQLRKLALSMVSHATLLRATGPLGTWDIDPQVIREKQHAGYVQRQTAIITAGLVLGVVVKTDSGFEVRS